MKKLGKLSIKPEKVIKNEELVNLKGGDYGGCCICYTGYPIYGPTNASECKTECKDAYETGYFWRC